MPSPGPKIPVANEGVVGPIPGPPIPPPGAGPKGPRHACMGGAPT